MNTYARQNLTFERGEGVWLWDTHGERYLDALSGIAVCGLGHSHPAVTQAVCEQAGKLVHTSNIYNIAAQTQLAERLCEISGMQSAFFCNSGAEANEAAIKLTRLHAHSRRIEEPWIAVMEQSFHGRTLATLTATGNSKIKHGFAPLMPGFVHAPYNDLAVLEGICTSHRKLAAIMLEPIQGEGGIRIPDKGYLAGIRKLCDRFNLLMILDEVQTGMGRTGKWFSYQHSEVMPDILTLAKGLGNGFPIGACLARGKAAETFVPGSHGSTFGGNPVACRAALAVIETIVGQNLCAQAAVTGKALLDGFRQQLKDLPGVIDIRGMGLMIGIELARDCGALVGQALEARLLINVTAGNVIRLLPPLITSESEASTIIQTVSSLVREFIQAESLELRI